MNGRSRARDAVISHLVQAHGAARHRLDAYADAIEQLQWVHFDTHAALEIVGLCPPDDHTHRAPLDQGLPLRIPDPCSTGLPQTMAAPGLELRRDRITDWAAAALLRKLAHHLLPADSGYGPALRRKLSRLDQDDLEQVAAEIRERITHQADAAARWLTRVGNPAQPAGLGDQTSSTRKSS